MGCVGGAAQDVLRDGDRVTGQLRVGPALLVRVRARVRIRIRLRVRLRVRVRVRPALLD
jgi:hypothetical protein